MMSTILIQKQPIRTKTLREISKLSKSYRHQADICIQNTILSMPQYLKSNVICYYVSTQYEVDTIQLIKKELDSKNKLVIVPKIYSHDLRLYEITSWRDIHIGTYGIQEPNDTCKHVAPPKIDLFLIPGIAFGQNGSRIGHGKGYYDRLLQKVKVPIIGLAYDIQMYSTVAHGVKDKKVDIIITETHIYDFSITPFRRQNL